MSLGARVILKCVRTAILVLGVLVVNLSWSHEGGQYKPITAEESDKNLRFALSNVDHKKYCEYSSMFAYYGAIFNVKHVSPEDPFFGKELKDVTFYTESSEDGEPVKGYNPPSDLLPTIMKMLKVGWDLLDTEVVVEEQQVVLDNAGKVSAYIAMTCIRR